MKRAVVTSLVLFLGLAVAGYVWLSVQLDTLDVALPEDTDTVFTIENGRNARQVADELEAQNLLPSALIWYGYARYLNLDRALKAGEYSISATDTPRTLLERFVEGKTILHSVTLIEGWTFRQAIEHIQAQPTVRVTLDARDDQAWIEALNTPYDHPEGLLFPSTYRFSRDTADIDLVTQANVLLKDKLASVWAAKSAEAPLETPYEALILASIIEKETARDDEREQIAGVFSRRLKKRMRLQTDPTVIYGLGDSYDGDIRRRDLTTDTPYNTYTRSGLTPTPIALVSARSLEAAVNPAPGKTLFFVATGEPDGSHYFSETLEEHEAAVKRYLVRLRSRRSAGQ